MTKNAYFTMPAHGLGGGVISLPQHISLHDDQQLSFSRPKTLGTCIGGFYEDEAGQEFMVKIGYSYRLDNNDPAKFYRAHLNNRWEALVNDLARIVLPDSTPDTALGRYEQDGVSFPCFISKKVEGYRDISDTSFHEEERKKARIKFHPDYVFNALITNDDIHDDNLGIDANGHAVNIDYGTTPSFIEHNQEPCKDIVHQVASFIGHQSLVGKQITKKRFFGYDEHTNPLNFGRDQKIKDNDISYYEVVLGAKTICEKQAAFLARTQEEIENIAGDTTIPDAIKEKLVAVFSNISSSLHHRIDYLGEHFGDDFAKVSTLTDDEKQLKWRHHPKFREIFEQHRTIDAAIAQQCYQQQFTDIAQMIDENATAQNFQDVILGNDFSTLSKDKQTAIRKMAGDHFLLHCSVINHDLDLTKWLLNHDIADINLAYRQRDYGYQYHMMSALSTAISMHNDAMVYDHDYHSCDDMIAFLHEKFTQRNPQSLEEGYANRKDISFVLTRSKMAFDLFEKSGEKIKAGDSIANAAKRYITVRDCTKLSAKEIEDVQH